MNHLNQLITHAISIINTEKGYFAKNQDNLEIKAKEYKGYIASFGTIVRQSGLLAATVLFASTENNSEKDKNVILEVILKILQKYRTEQYGNVTSLSEYAFQLNQEKRSDTRIRKDVMDAAIALKLALRTFKMD